MNKISWVKRGIEDSKEFLESDVLKVFFIFVSAILVALVSFLGEGAKGYSLFGLLFLSGIIAPMFIGFMLFIYSLIKPIKRFQFTIIEVSEAFSGANTFQAFGLIPFSQNQQIGNLKVRFKQPDGNVTKWLEIKHNLFATSEKCFFFEPPKELELMEGLYEVEVKSTVWGSPSLLIAKEKFVYKNKDWNIKK